MGHLVRHWDISCLEHFIVEFFLLKFSQLIFELVFVQDIVANPLSDRLADFFANGVLLSDDLPKRALISILVYAYQGASHNRSRNCHDLEQV